MTFQVITELEGSIVSFSIVYNFSNQCIGAFLVRFRMEPVYIFQLAENILLLTVNVLGIIKEIKIHDRKLLDIKFINIFVH